MLKIVGHVNSWKRNKGTKGEPLTFGFVEYSEIEGLVRCVRLLNGLNLFGENLLVKPSEKADLAIKEWEQACKAEFLQAITNERNQMANQ